MIIYTPEIWSKLQKERLLTVEINQILENKILKEAADWLREVYANSDDMFNQLLLEKYGNNLDSLILRDAIKLSRQNILKEK